MKALIGGIARKFKHLLAVGFWALSSLQGAMAGPAAPEAATGYTERSAVTRPHQMIVTATPLSSAAGMAMLRRGGSALDAAIAAQAMLGLTEPQSSGIGGGAFLVYFDGGRVTTFDGRETAPAAARPDRFLGTDGKSMDFYRAVVGGRSVGVPGVLAMLAQAHRRYGRLPWATLFQPAIRQAEQGFPISPRLYGLLSRERFLAQDPVARQYFYRPDGSPKPIGTRLKNPDYAATLRLIARRGPQAFYQGKLAADIVKAVNQAPGSPGDMTADDLENYRAIERAPVCGSYRGYRLCGMGPPSSGGIAVLQMLKTLERFPLTDMAPTSVQAVHLFSEAGRLAFADRARYLADPAFVPVPTSGLLDPAYLATRSQLIQPGQSMGQASPGLPPGQVAAWGRDQAVELPCTTQIAVVDRFGQALSMTTTIEDQFGSRIMVPGRGFLLNNQLTDFSFSPQDQGKPVANRIEGGKRPRSAMAPMLVFDPSGKLYAVTGSPGGSAIINYVAQTLIGLLDWHLDPQQAVSLPHYGSRNGPTELESGRGLGTLVPTLQALGHKVVMTDMTSGLAAILRTPGGWTGGADPRREGRVEGD
ncbi:MULTISPECIES: gamma-glutamyltransferase [unclassified Paludibacterium]|uniref:gamma-glutamyltransferase n=1 Tax=unclassified Paludibacterium TaxID=2618429 RepID=UPI001C0480B2|nr:gamma-glutamyltransferase [Paludibacterium sp. B53371]BEV72705.1 gamma-glutamyltransferase [Paludibacterium sp. THUN1379]